MGDDKKPHRNWSITINNPIDTDLVCSMPGWKLEGQYEEGKEGTRHFQGLLNTPPVRFGAVKRQFPRAHIEVARDIGALRNYVHKDDTRVAEFNPNNVPSMFEFQNTISGLWDWDTFRLYVEQQNKTALNSKEILTMDDHALNYLDTLVAECIEDGQIGLEFIAINPMWRSSWKRFWRAILKRNNKIIAPPNIPECPVAQPDLPVSPE